MEMRMPVVIIDDSRPKVEWRGGDGRQIKRPFFSIRMSNSLPPAIIATGRANAPPMTGSATKQFSQNEHAGLLRLRTQ